MSRAPRAGRRLLARLVAALLLVLGAPLPPGMPPAADAAQPPGQPRVQRPGTTDTGRLRLTGVSPPVARPGTTVVVSGRLAAGAAYQSATVRVVRARVATATRSEVAAWAEGTGAVAGTEIGRTTVPPVAVGGTADFRVEFPADAVRQTRSVAAVPLVVELSSPGAPTEVLRTFVGWAGANDYQPLTMATVVPLTLGPDPALFSSDDPARTTAWAGQTGSAGRLTALARALGPLPVPLTLAIDPATLGPTRSPARGGADPATAQRVPFGQALADASRSHQLLALPYADPDLAAIGAQTGSPIVTDQVARATRLGVSLSVPAGTGVAWPVDGALPPGRETMLRAAYGDQLRAVLTSGVAVTGPTVLTPSALARTADGLPVLRWDDALSSLTTEVAAADLAVVSAQELVAQTAALVGERPSVARGVLVTIPRGADPDPGALAAYLSVAGQVPWLRTVSLDGLLASDLERTTLPTPPLAAPDAGQTPVTALTIAALRGELLVLQSLGSCLPASTALLDTPRDLADQVLSSRWREAGAGFEATRQLLREQTTQLTASLSIAPQTTNFLADEGLLQVTVVNDLPEPVTGVRVVLAPTNPRLQVVEQAPALTVAARSRATVSVRLAAVAHGLVPVNATLRAADGSQIGSPAQITVRANPPGVWLYVAGGVLFGLVLVVGAVRALRQPRSAEVEAAAEVLDPVETPPEPPRPAG